VNILLFSQNEWNKPLSRDDPRVAHIQKILGKFTGETLRVGCLGRGRGEAKILEMPSQGDLVLEFPSLDTLAPGPPSLPVVLLLGHPRIPVIQRLCRDLASFGVAGIAVCGTDLGEKSYFSSSFWTRNQAQNLAIEGAQQGGLTVLPAIDRWWSVADFLEKNTNTYREYNRYVLHPSHSHSFFAPTLAADFIRKTPRGVLIAVGPERGWSDREVDRLMGGDFTPLSLGPYTWRTESAAVFAAGLSTHLYSATEQQ